MVALMIFIFVAETDPLPPTFLFPEDIEDGEGVRIEAQGPESFHDLIPKDETRPNLRYAPVATEGTKQGVRIWYLRVDPDERNYADQRALCLGILKYGAWTLPSLAPDAPAWGGPNNVVMRRSPHKSTWAGFNVFQIVRRRGPYRMLYWDQPKEGDAGAMLASSVDGVAWTKDPRGTVFTEPNDAFTLLLKGTSYLLYQTALEPWPDKPYPGNLRDKQRVQSIRTSRDLVEWSPQRIFLRPDESDEPHTEFYLMKPFSYARGYAGLLTKYCADPTRSNRQSATCRTELIVSRDARDWARPYRETDLGFWTYADPFLADGKLQFAYFDDRAGAMKLAQYAPGALTAVVAGQQEGGFVTKPFTVPPADLAIHADARNGWIDVEILDSQKAALAGFGPCRVANAKGTELILEWEGFYSSQLPLTQCRLRFRMQNAKLYAVTTLGT